MTLLGLSILIASVSFICYKHPPATWSFLRWLQRPSSPSLEKKGDAPASIQEPPPTITTSDDTGDDSQDNTSPKEEVRIIPEAPKKEDLDRKAMPPPPPPTLSKPSSPTTPRAKPFSTPTSVPSFTLTDGASASSMPPPSFPALNSAQRASGGTRGPPRLSAPGLMAPPSRPSPLPNRGPASSNTSSLAPPPSHSSVPAKPRKKVQLTPNHSPLDWARLTSSSSTLSGLPPSTPYLKVPPSLLKQFTGRKGKDAWTVLGGKVYNISPYLPYHPGGEPELLRCAGREGTRLFAEVHPWVNWEGMLEKCLVGIAVDEGEIGGGLEEMD